MSFPKPETDFSGPNGGPPTTWTCRFCGHQVTFKERIRNTPKERHESWCHLIQPKSRRGSR